MCLDGAVLYFNYFSQCYNVVMVELYVSCIDMYSSYSKSLVITSGVFLCIKSGKFTNHLQEMCQNLIF